VLSLPIFPELTVAEQQAVVDSIAHFYARRRIQAA
jgi:dTDP-4-amino-4,6-dideoxygalactose transaminase